MISIIIVEEMDVYNKHSKRVLERNVHLPVFNENIFVGSTNKTSTICLLIMF